MIVTISRIRTNSLYTLSEFRINGSHVAFTLESTAHMLIKGKYAVRIAKHSARKQDIFLYTEAPKGSKHPLQNTHIAIVLGNSWKDAARTSNIIIGLPLIPGVMYKGREIYENLVDRVTKCMERKEGISLVISDEHMKDMPAIKHWK